MQPLALPDNTYYDQWDVTLTRCVQDEDSLGVTLVGYYFLWTILCCRGEAWA